MSIIESGKRFSKKPSNKISGKPSVYEGITEGIIAVEEEKPVSKNLESEIKKNNGAQQLRVPVIENLIIL